MRNIYWFSAICALGALSIFTACGDGGTGTTSTGSGGGTTSTTSGTTAASTTAASTSAATGTSTGTGSNLINGCDPMALTDMTGMAKVTIKFGDPIGLKYDPACITVTAGTVVTFEGTFLVHPLAGGVSPDVDPMSPIKETLMGTTADFTLSMAGMYPFFCEDHSAVGMEGLIVAK